MLKKIRSYFIKLFVPILYPIYRREIQDMMNEHAKDQLIKVQNMIKEAVENGLDLYVEINPNLISPLAMSTGYTEEEEEKENPFKLVVDNEEE